MSSPYTSIPPPTPPQELFPPSSGVGKLQGFNNWHTWHIKKRMALQKMGLRYLLTDDGLDEPDDPETANQYASDRAAGVQFLVDGISEGMLAKAYGLGWKPEDATVQSTLNTLEAIVEQEQRRRRDEEEKTTTARRCMAGLARMDLAAGAQTIKEYILTAKHCHDGLVTHCGDGASTVEEVLEQLFVVSLLEGLRETKPEWYCEWMEMLKDGTESTRAGVTEWLLAKDAAATKTMQEVDAVPIIKLAPRPSVKRPGLGGDGGGGSGGSGGPRGRQQRCSYCADHHAQSTNHEETACWFLNPHKAPRKWQSKYKNEVEELKERQRFDGKRKRPTWAPSHRP